MTTAGDDRGVPGLRLMEGWLDASASRLLLERVDAEPWSDALARRVQHYGWRYDYKKRSVSAEDFLGPLPTWALPLVERLGAVFDAPPEQLIVNEYAPGQGIAAHADAPGFGPVVASLSLGAPVVMRLVDPEGGAEAQLRELWLRPGSLLVLSGPARHRWTHAIAKRRTDPAPPGAPSRKRVPRGRRVSLTFRTVRR